MIQELQQLTSKCQYVEEKTREGIFLMFSQKQNRTEF